MRSGEPLVRRRVGPVHMVLASAMIFLVSILMAQLNVLLAYAILEGAAIAFSLFIFIFSTQTRKFTRDDYLLLVGYGCLAAAILDFFSLLTFPGGPFFQGFTDNESAQFWIAARYIYGFSLLIAPFAAKKRFRAKIVLPAYVFAAGVAIASILVFKTFPTCYIPAQGLTPVKVFSEYIICLILVGAIWFTWDFRTEIGSSVASLVILSMFMVIACEICATLYTDVQSLAVLLAHVFKGVGMYLIFHGTVAEGLNRPFEEMAQAREKLAERLRFESLLNDISSELAEQTSLQGIHAAIRGGLFKLVDFLNSSRGILLNLDGEDARVLAAVKVNQLHALDLQNPMALVQWLSDHYGHGCPLVTASLPEILPPGIQKRDEPFLSCAFVPSNSPAGGHVALCLLSPRPDTGWDEALAPRLRLAGELFVNALNRGQAHQEKQKLTDELNHVARVSTMGQLTAALAHEIKQPLTAILSNAQVGLRHLEADTPDFAELSSIFRDIVSDDRRATEVITHIRSMVKKEQRPRAPAVLSHLANGLVGMLGDSLNGTRITVQTGEDEMPVVVDSTQIQQVMLNLIMNALDALEGIPVSARQIKVSIGAHTGSMTGMKVAVADNGPGISGEDQTRIFEPFVSTKKEGMGMGLAICRGIIEDHGGRLWIDHTGPDGTVMAFSVP